MTTLHFHVTPESNLAEIVARGLIPAVGPRSSAASEAVPALCFFASPEALEDAMGGWLDGAFDDDEKLCVLEVDLSGIPLNDSSAAYEKVALVAVPPDRIRSVKPL